MKERKSLLEVNSVTPNKVVSSYTRLVEEKSLLTYYSDLEKKRDQLYWVYYWLVRLENLGGLLRLHRMTNYTDRKTTEVLDDILWCLNDKGYAVRGVTTEKDTIQFEVFNKVEGE